MMHSYIKTLSRLCPSLDLSIEAETLGKLDAPGARWLWMDGWPGADLIRLDVSDLQERDGLVALSRKPERICLLQDDRVVEIDAETARAELARRRWRVLSDGAVMRGETYIADIVVEARRERLSAWPRAIARVVPLRELSAADISALYHVAIDRGVRTVGTLLGRIEDILLNDEPLLERLARVRGSRDLALA